MNGTATQTLWCETALTPEGWRDGVSLEVDRTGTIIAVSRVPAPGDAQRLGMVLPGMPNLHSHAFQRGMAGLTETAGLADDDFWTWRQTMYGFVNVLTPDQMEAIATQLYVEMVKAGYTAVAEFHYLHNTPGGGAYDDRAELSRRIARAAATAGIRLTLLPVLYQQGGFGGTPLTDAQQRFRLETGDWLALVQDLQSGLDPTTQRAAIALHSLRAVAPEAQAEAVAGYRSFDADGPIHIHIAEQPKEVVDCEAWSGARPVAWLLDHHDIDARWVLVHATHMTDKESAAAAASGAIAGLCPTTEANLGDGVFDLTRWVGAGGAFGIGSDGNTSIDPREELRWLEYAQRLTSLRRAVVARAPGSNAGVELWRAAVAGGAAALGQPTGHIAPGNAADLVVLDGDDPMLTGRTGGEILDSLVFSGLPTPVKEVWVAGQRQVEDGKHPAEEKARDAYATAMTQIRDAL